MYIIGINFSCEVINVDLIFCGIIDIVLVLLAIVFLIVGYKKGFIKKIISLVGIIIILIVSFIYCGQFANFLREHNIIYPDLESSIGANIAQKISEANISPEAGIKEFLTTGLNIPSFISGFIANGIINSHPELTNVEQMVSATTQYACQTIMNIISFFILAIGIFIIILIIKLIASVLRTNKFVRVVDGILGAVLYVTIFIAIVCIVFTVISYCMDKEWFSPVKEWLTVDMQLNTDKFRLSKWIYEGNIIRRILNLFFG